MAVSAQELNVFVRLSKWAGERWDWIRAGGGNIAIKTDKGGELLIKSSGLALTMMEENHGHCILSLKPIQDLVREVQKCNFPDKRHREEFAKAGIDKLISTDCVGRPSIETFMHAFLFKYTLHLHPLSVLSAICSPQGKEYATAFFNDRGIPGIFLQYATPGIDLAIELLKGIDLHLEKSDELPKVVLMRNHGVLISSNSVKELRELMESCTQFFEKISGLDFSSQSAGHKISAMVNMQSHFPTVVLVGDHPIYRQAFEKKFNFTTLVPITPDDLVYWGKRVLVLESLDGNALENFKTQYFHWPKVLVWERRIFFLGATMAKCHATEEVFRGLLMMAFQASLQNYTPLPETELNYLGQWEAEKYRQDI